MLLSKFSGGEKVLQISACSSINFTSDKNLKSWRRSRIELKKRKRLSLYVSMLNIQGASNSLTGKVSKKQQTLAIQK